MRVRANVVIQNVTLCFVGSEKKYKSFIMVSREDGRALQPRDIVLPNSNNMCFTRFAILIVEKRNEFLVGAPKVGGDGEWGAWRRQWCWVEASMKIHPQTMNVSRAHCNF